MKYAICITLIMAAIVACHVTPLPVPNRGDWDPGNGATDYPPMAAHPVADAGADARP